MRAASLSRNSAARDWTVGFLFLQLLPHARRLWYEGSFNHVQRQRQSSVFLLSRKEYQSCAVFLMLDRDTQRVYRMHDFSKAHQLVPGQTYCVAGKVNSADKLYLVIESVRLDIKDARPSIVPAPADGAGGLPLD